MIAANLIRQLDLPYSIARATVTTAIIAMDTATLPITARCNRRIAPMIKPEPEKASPTAKTA